MYNNGYLKFYLLLRLVEIKETKLVSIDYAKFSKFWIKVSQHTLFIIMVMKLLKFVKYLWICVHIYFPHDPLFFSMCSPKIQNNKKNNSATQCTEIIFFVPGIWWNFNGEEKNWNKVCIFLTKAYCWGILMKKTDFKYLTTSIKLRRK